MFASDRWETVRQIADRKHITLFAAEDGIEVEFISGKAELRFTDGDAGGLEFRLKK